MVVWVELCPPNRYVEVLAPIPMNVTLFKNRVSADVIKLKSLEQALNQQDQYA